MIGGDEEIVEGMMLTRDAEIPRRPHLVLYAGARSVLLEAGGTDEHMNVEWVRRHMSVYVPVKTENRALVGANGSGVVSVSNLGLIQGMSREDALNCAAWIVAIVDPAQCDFPDVLAAVLST